MGSWTTIGLICLVVWLVDAYKHHVRKMQADADDRERLKHLPPDYYDWSSQSPDELGGPRKGPPQGGG